MARLHGTDHLRMHVTRIRQLCNILISGLAENGSSVIGPTDARASRRMIENATNNILADN